MRTSIGFQRRLCASVPLWLFAFVFAFAFVFIFAPPAARADQAGLGFFESKVRPLLIERCYACHSTEAKKAKGQLYLDTRDGVLTGGESGPAIVPGKPDESLLIRAVRRTDEKLTMPPKEPLRADEVAVLERWVRMGAPDPRTKSPVATKAGTAAQWSLQPIRAVDPPAVKDSAWPAGPIDRFVLAKLEAANLRPSPAASKRELLRRVTFDLTGLPPTPAEIDAFLADSSPEAFARVVDRLLASPRYGERWGRHWLDVVRFGESHGYEQNHLRDRAWPYRDYVIRAFNDDKPYDRFVAEQLAGDVVAAGDPVAEAATGFLVAGVHDTVNNNAEAAKRQQRADDLEDIVSTVSAAFLGLTVGCAKCHDHKFDPIPQTDYYALAAVFAGVRHEERVLPSSLPKEKRTPKNLAEASAVPPVPSPAESVGAASRPALKTSGDDSPARLAGPTLPPVGAPAAPRAAVNPRRNVEDFAPVSAWFVRFVVQSTLDGREPCIDEIEIYAPGGKENLALAASGAKATASSLLPGHAIHQISHLNDGLYGNSHSWISNERGKGWVQIELPREQVIAKFVWGRDNGKQPKYTDRLAAKYRVDVSMDGRTWTTVAPDKSRAPAPDTTGGDRAYVGKFTTPDTVYLLRRGDVMQRGDEIGPAGLTQVPQLPGDLALPASASEGARRAALAKWICDPRNPLTARVMVNRTWQHHFGRGLVNTPSDFGANGETPSHPELLDWLTSDFVKGGWTLKRLHRQMVLSRTYQQAGRPDDTELAAGMAADGGNRFLWRMPLRRLEAEAVRDSILAVSGKLDLSPPAVGGPGFRLFNYRVVNIALYTPMPEQGPATWRRAVYQQAARNIHDDLMAAFDEPENAQRSPRREVTVNALQALTLLHSPFVVQQSEFFAERVRREAGDRDEAQVSAAFRLALGREPTVAEQERGVELAQRHGLAALCRALFNTNEFLTY